MGSAHVVCKNYLLQFLKAEGFTKKDFLSPKERMEAELEFLNSV
jgi:hypothetical protein